MTVRRLAAVDAQTYWMSAKIPNDAFLLYGFDGVPAGLDHAVEVVRRRADACPELRVRIRDGGPLTYPTWVDGPIDADRFSVHELDDNSWQGCLAFVCRLADSQLDPRVSPWRVHVFSPVDGVPTVSGLGAVAVVQMSHALADGVRSSALAARLFGRAAAIEPVATPRWRGVTLPWRSVVAARTHRELVRDTEAGVVPLQAPSRPALRSNARPAGVRSARTLIRRRDSLSRPTVTVGVLCAVSEALSAHLRALGDDPSALGAEVPMAKTGVRQANNHFGNVAVGLYPELDVDQRADRIVADLADRRRRAQHPAMRAASRAYAAVPAPLLRWGVAQFDPTLRSPMVTGNTVVSSVNRGPADLSFGDARVVLTAGYPALSPMMGLSHGVHGIGDTIAVSVHAAESAIGDVDEYVARLDAALPG
ncbi:WS/DGAT domain-containing protein [Mycolicibacterium sp. 120270]|uniref:WS/DGAT domain-containing protein n=1 Tax=Mycolicibacterium sp. 120270 TaxID=3090600 RepID=UPI00299D4EB6|nr:WS/DGAT domain-containing protein [Mycolicibacterium sp. 120270]MDX1886079.1 WS/DGAT domain-containing protein [Mycolicibacterium sp. 120270]